MPDIHAQIRRAAKTAGIPERLFESLILHGERSYQGWQRSPAGAFGPAQLMPGTASYLARKYGINTNTYEGNLLGGAYYLKEQLAAFGGNPRKAVAAYNAGPGAVQSGSLPAETQRYLKNVFGNLRGAGKVTMPVGARERTFVPGTPAIPGTPPTSEFSLRSPEPIDILGPLTEGIGQIAQGYNPTETLKLTVPTVLESWLRPSTLVETKIPGIPGIPGVPGVTSSTGSLVNARGQQRQIQGRVVPLSGKLIGTPYAGTHTLGNWESDNAVDIAAPVGTPIRAVADGVIGPQFGSLGRGGQFAGLRLHLVSKGNEFYYAHMSSFAPGVKPGTRVKRGQVIGYSGEANGVGHLHFAQRKGNPVGAARKH